MKALFSADEREYLTVQLDHIFRTWNLLKEKIRAGDQETYQYFPDRLTTSIVMDAYEAFHRSQTNIDTLLNQLGFEESEEKIETLLALREYFSSIRNLWQVGQNTFHFLERHSLGTMGKIVPDQDIKNLLETFIFPYLGIYFKEIRAFTEDLFPDYQPPAEPLLIEDSKTDFTALSILKKKKSDRQGFKRSEENPPAEMLAPIFNLYNLAARVFEELREGDLASISHARCLELESRLLAAESEYDNAVKARYSSFQLIQFREGISSAHALAEILVNLVRFLRRHVMTPLGRRVDVQDNMTAHILDIIENFNFRYIGKYFDQTTRIIEQVYPQKKKQVAYELEILNDLGLHARAAALIYALAKHYLDLGQKVFYEYEGKYRQVAKDLGIMALLMSTKSKGEKIKVKGDQEALDSLKLLVAHHFGEEGFDLPEALGFLMN